MTIRNPVIAARTTRLLYTYKLICEQRRFRRENSFRFMELQNLTQNEYSKKLKVVLHSTRNLNLSMFISICISNSGKRFGTLPKSYFANKNEMSLSWQIFSELVSHEKEYMESNENMWSYLTVWNEKNKWLDKKLIYFNYAIHKRKVDVFNWRYNYTYCLRVFHLRLLAYVSIRKHIVCK